jgi:hypothetical protein
MIYKVSFILAAIDALLALVLAFSGDGKCVIFVLLAGLMYVHGCYYKSNKNGGN